MATGGEERAGSGERTGSEGHGPDRDWSYPAVGLIRAARRRADCSQRELARNAGVAWSTVARIESGERAPSLRLFFRLIVAAGLFLVVVDRDGRVVQPMLDREDLRDGAERRYPSHLDTVVDPEQGEWWADAFGLARPPETFYRDRQRRDAQRRRSQWEVRVRQHYNWPEPPDPRWSERWRWWEPPPPWR
jgi:transcriptional regulator with XRE-family HTH domain